MTACFHLGQRVVCIDDFDVDDTGATTGIKYLRRGRLYTVSRTYVLPSGPGVNLQEIDRPYSYEGFRAERFRPAIEHQEDISVFTRELETASRSLQRVLTRLAPRPVCNPPPIELDAVAGGGSVTIIPHDPDRKTRIITVPADINLIGSALEKSLRSPKET